jgi:hypothetical protein
VISALNGLLEAEMATRMREGQRGFPENGSWFPRDESGSL